MGTVKVMVEFVTYLLSKSSVIRAGDGLKIKFNWVMVLESGQKSIIQPVVRSFASLT